MFCILMFAEHVLCQFLISVCRQVMHVLNYYSTKFHEILMSSSIEISAFPLNHAIIIFCWTVHALHLTGSLIHTNNPRKEGYFLTVLPLLRKQILKCCVVSPTCNLFSAIKAFWYYHNNLNCNSLRFTTLAKISNHFWTEIAWKFHFLSLLEVPCSIRKTTAYKMHVHIMNFITPPRLKKVAKIHNTQYWTITVETPHLFTNWTVWMVQSHVITFIFCGWS